MYLVANVSKRNIVIGDMDVSLQPRQALDLHKIKCKIEPENSKDLKLSTNTGLVKVLKKSKKQVYEEEKIDLSNNLSQEDLIKMIKDTIKKEMASQSSQNTEQDSDKILDALKDLTKLVQDKPESVVHVEKTKENVNTDDDSYVDEDKLAEIHARSMNKISKESDTFVEYDKQEVSDDSILDNINELENLI